MLLLCVLTVNIDFAQAPCAPSKHSKLPTITDLTYAKARKKLLIAGWQPFRTIHHNDGDKNPDIAYGNGQLFWKRGYREVESCSGTGIASCSFLFEDVYGNRLRVTTAGEEILKQKSYAMVTSYQFVCDARFRAFMVDRNRKTGRRGRVGKVVTIPGGDVFNKRSQKDSAVESPFV